MSVARYLKERMSYVLPTSQDPKSREKKTFVLPDGNEVTVDNSIFSDCTASMFANERSNNGGVGSTTFEALMLCDESIRKDISQHIILAGGTSMLPGSYLQSLCSEWMWIHHNSKMQLIYSFLSTSY